MENQKTYPINYQPHNSEYPKNQKIIMTDRFKYRGSTKQLEGRLRATKGQEEYNYISPVLCHEMIKEVELVRRAVLALSLWRTEKLFSTVLTDMARGQQNTHFLSTGNTSTTVRKEESKTTCGSQIRNTVPLN